MVSTDVLVEAFSDALAVNLGFNMQAVIGISTAAGNLNERLRHMLIGWDATAFENEIAAKTQQKRTRGLGPGGPTF
jgi:hypothetical protein